MKTVTGLFDNYNDASAAVSALEARGVPSDDISIVSNNADNRHKHEDNDNGAAEGAGTGAGIGAVVGGAGGLVHVVGTGGHQLNHFQIGRSVKLGRANFDFVDDQNFGVLDPLFQRVYGGERIFCPGVCAIWARQRGSYGFAFQPNNLHGRVSPVELLEG